MAFVLFVGVFVGLSLYVPPFPPPFPPPFSPYLLNDYMSSDRLGSTILAHVLQVPFSPTTVAKERR